MGILGVNHIAFRTPDVACLRAFYAELLGAESLGGAHGRRGEVTFDDRSVYWRE